MTHTLTSSDGTPISRFAFGTMQFGGRADARDSAAMFEACIAAGITHFDTAHVYTGGQSEEILGQLARGCRERLIVATKVGYVSAVPKVLQADFDQSRQRLQMDHVDVLYLHRYPPDAALEGVLDCLAEMHQRGLFSYLGLSNFAAWQVMKTVAMARDRGLTVDILQPMYSLVKRQAEVEILPMCADQGIAVAPYSPLGGGLLTGKYQSGGDGRLTQDHRYAARYAPNWMQAVASGLGEIARELAVHPATLAAAWAARHEAGPMPILSARNAEQLLPSLEAVNYDMDDALYARLTALSPTPAPATDRLEEA